LGEIGWMRVRGPLAGDGGDGDHDRLMLQAQARVTRHRGAAA
jgi:hypothetical protein